MNSNIHPPLYLVVATVSFFLGAMIDLPDDSTGLDNSTASASSAGPVIAELPASEASGATADSRAEALSESHPATNLETPVESVSAAPEEQLPVSNSSRQAEQSHDAGAVGAPNPLADFELPKSPVLRSRLGDVEIFPPTNPWNQDISKLPVHPQSSVWIRSIGLDKHLHPDFGTVWQGSPIGIPFVIVPPNYPKRNVPFEYADESDPGSYPLPPNPPIEGGADAPYDHDRHVIMIDPQRKLLYELFQVIPDPVAGWRAGSGAIFDLSSNKVRPYGWTSADAAGLPIFPGLVRFDEVAEGEIRHALRFTVARTQRACIFPARHFASRSSDPNLPPLGLRVRLRADYDLSAFPPKVQIILRALKKYGMLLADNGSNWFVSGAPDSRWDDSELATMKQIKGGDFECVLTGELIR